MLAARRLICLGGTLALLALSRAPEAAAQQALCARTHVAPALVADGNATGAAASMVIAPQRGIAVVVLFSDRLTGHVTATSRGDRTHFVLPYFVSLRLEAPRR